MDPDEKAFDLAQSTVTQLITLSTAVIAFTITFSNEWLAPASAGGVRLVAVAAWLAFLFSILAGVACLMAMAGVLADRTAAPSINARNIRAIAGAQILSFVVGIVVTVLFGILSL